MNIVAKVETNTIKILFHYRKQYEYIIQPLTKELGTCANAAGKKLKYIQSYLHTK
jgi:hypothetical protein